MNTHKPGIYEKYIKRLLDFTLSLCALIVLSPVLLILTVIGAIAMKGNPFFTQKRPGKDEVIFKLVKFRTMSNAKDKTGNLLPDDMRLTKYGKLLRSTSLDELPELWNILKGEMSIVGPRPLLVEYLERYDETQARRHEVRPGLTGLAQVNGRNAITWEDRFKLDIEYIDSINFAGDIKIIFKTVEAVIRKTGISSESSSTMEVFMGTTKRKVS